MAESIFAVFDNDILVSTIADALLWYFNSRIILLESIGVRSFSTLYGYGIVIDGHIAVLDKDVLAYIKENGACVGLTTEVRVAEIGKDPALQLPRLDCNDFPPKSENYKKWMQ